MNLTGELDDNDYDDEFDDKGALRLILMFVPPLHYGSKGCPPFKKVQFF